MPRTTELLYAGQPVQRPPGADWGIITEAVPADQLEERVTTLARRLAEGQPALSAVKAAINRAVCQGWTISWPPRPKPGRPGQNEDHMEAVTAFLEKRKPVFQGQIDTSAGGPEGWFFTTIHGAVYNWSTDGRDDMELNAGARAVFDAMAEGVLI
jgi:hypothetical protein